MPNRQERRRLKKLGLQPHTPETGTPKPAQEKPPMWRSMFSAWWQIFLAAGGIVGFVVTVLSLRSVLEVTTLFQSDPTTPYSEVFVISNGGMLPLYSLKSTCGHNWYKDNGHNILKEVSEYNSNDVIPRLGSGAKWSIKCRQFVATGNAIIEASISLIIEYHTLLPFYTAKKVFPFIGVRTKDGPMQWAPLPS